MMKILFDHQKFTTQKYGGISRYFSFLVDELRANPDYDYLLGLLFSKNYYLKDEPLKLGKFISSHLLDSRFGAKLALLNKKYSASLLKKGDFDIFHPTYYDPYYISLCKKPVVTTVHDMTHEKLPEYFWANDTLTYQKRLSIESADHIIAISEATRNDLLEYSKVDPKRVSVIYHGIDIKTPLRFKEVDALPEQYLLFVGDRSGYKNFYLFMKAFSIVKRAFPDLRVILTGGGPVGIADTEFLSNLGVIDDVRHINVTDEELNYLYKHTAVFVYPSLNEGFGLPVLEAFKAGCAVLLSDTACFREIAADAAAYFAPLDLESLITQLQSLLQSSVEREVFIAKGFERLKMFPIEKCTSETLSLYKQLV